jgi:hypothetical protein
MSNKHRMAGLDMTELETGAVVQAGAVQTVGIPATCIVHRIRVVRTEVGGGGNFDVSVRNRDTGYVAALNQLFSKTGDALDFDSGEVTQRFVNFEAGVAGQTDEIYVHIDPAGAVDDMEFTIHVVFSSRLS